MPSYQATAVKFADSKSEMLASHEFEARDTSAAKAAADEWSKSAPVTSSGSTLIRLYAGKVLISEFAVAAGAWQDVRRP
jgi:hypothetical protein